MEEMSKERRAVGTLVAAQLCLIGVFSLGAGSALADSPHFVKQDAVVDGSGNLDCSFKVAGLGDNQSILVTCSADASAFYACFNKGGNHPQASNKEDAAGPVSGSDEFTSGKNGQVTGSVEVNPPASTLTCPGNQVRRLCSVSYTNIVLTADSLQASVPGTLSREFIDCF
jgi:hypothetical protein